MMRAFTYVVLLYGVSVSLFEGYYFSTIGIHEELSSTERLLLRGRGVLRTVEI